MIREGLLKKVLFNLLLLAFMVNKAPFCLKLQLQYEITGLVYSFMSLRIRNKLLKNIYSTTPFLGFSLTFKKSN